MNDSVVASAEKLGHLNLNFAHYVEHHWDHEYRLSPFGLDSLSPCPHTHDTSQPGIVGDCRSFFVGSTFDKHLNVRWYSKRGFNPPYALRNCVIVWGEISNSVRHWTNQI
jgi:hypothetical protein